MNSNQVSWLAIVDSKMAIDGVERVPQSDGEILTRRMRRVSPLVVDLLRRLEATSDLEPVKRGGAAGLERAGEG